jgi:hypothetical protein
LTITNSNRLVLLDYVIKPGRTYTEQPKKPHLLLFDLINQQKTGYESLLGTALNYREEILSIREDRQGVDTVEPGWNNGYFPGLDMIMLYTILSKTNPATYVEIGSGTSTRVAYKAKTEQRLSTSIISIDPKPRKATVGIADTIEKKELQKIPVSFFESLNEGDILFFDGTHTLYPNSDVMWFFLEVLPIIKKGVIVHIHDIYLPYDYPQFMCDRYYNEQYILASCLLNNPSRYRIICPNYFIYTEPTLHRILQPFWEHQVLQAVEKHGGSFWMRIE